MRAFIIMTWRSSLLEGNHVVYSVSMSSTVPCCQFQHKGIIPIGSKFHRAFSTNPRSKSNTQSHLGSVRTNSIEQVAGPD